MVFDHKNSHRPFPLVDSGYHNALHLFLSRTIMTNETQSDPLEFLKNMWGNMGFTLPGMVTPTMDTDELGKRIADLKAVEGWLKTNLGMLQMSIQALEMQRSTLMAFQQMSQAAAQSQSESGHGDANAMPNPFLNPAAWQMPWNMMGGAVSPAPTSGDTKADTPESSSSPSESAGAAKKSKPKG